jgi:hypothetical protein
MLCSAYNLQMILPISSRNPQSDCKWSLFEISIWRELRKKEHSMTRTDWLINVNTRAMYFVKISSAFVRDAFGIGGLLSKLGRNFKLALETMRGSYIKPGDRSSDWPEKADGLALRLYGLLHTKFR